MGTQCYHHFGGGPWRADAAVAVVMFIYNVRRLASYYLTFQLLCAGFMARFSSKLAGPSLRDWANIVIQKSANWVRYGREGRTQTVCLFTK